MCPGCPTFSIPIPIPKEAMEFGPAAAATPTASAAGHAPEEVRRNGQLGLQPEYYTAREKVIVAVSTHKATKVGFNWHLCNEKPIT